MTKQELVDGLYSSGFATRTTLKEAFDDLSYTIHRVASKHDIAPLHTAVQVVLNSLAREIEALDDETAATKLMKEYGATNVRTYHLPK